VSNGEFSAELQFLQLAQCRPNEAALLDLIMRNVISPRPTLANFSVDNARMASAGAVAT